MFLIASKNTFCTSDWMEHGESKYPQKITDNNVFLHWESINAEHC